MAPSMRIKHCESSQTICSCEATQSEDSFILCRIWMGPRIAAHSAEGKKKNIFCLFYCYYAKLVLAWFPAGTKKICGVQHLKASSRVQKSYKNMTTKEKKKKLHCSGVQRRILMKFLPWANLRLLRVDLHWLPSDVFRLPQTTMLRR